MCRSLTVFKVWDCTETIYQRLTKPMPAHADTISRGPIPHSYTLLRHQALDLYDYNTICCSEIMFVQVKD